VRPDAHLRHLGGGLPLRRPARVARQRRGVTIIEINAQPTPLTQEGVSDYLIAGQTGQVLPAVADEVKKRMGK